MTYLLIAWLIVSLVIEIYVSQGRAKEAQELREELWDVRSENTRLWCGLGEMATALGEKMQQAKSAEPCGIDRAAEEQEDAIRLKGLGVRA